MNMIYGFDLIWFLNKYFLITFLKSNISYLSYSSCNVAQKTCDVEFRSCLRSKCNENGKLSRLVCKKVANGMYVAVKKAGCKAYLSSQAKSCNCV